VCLQINTVKYDANREIMNICKNLQIVWSLFCTDLQLFVYIRSTSNIYLFIGIQICCKQIQTNSHSVTFGYSQYLVQHLMNDPKGRKTTIHCYLPAAEVWDNGNKTFYEFVVFGLISKLRSASETSASIDYQFFLILNAEYQLSGKIQTLE
jgi:hypothetical protein